MAQVTGTVNLSTTAAQLPGAQCVEAVLSNNDASIAVLVGFNSTTQNFTLRPGATASFRVSNLNRLYAKSASGTPVLSYATF